MVWMLNLEGYAVGAISHGMENLIFNDRYLP